MRSNRPGYRSAPRSGGRRTHSGRLIFPAQTGRIPRSAAPQTGQERVKPSQGQLTRLGLRSIRDRRLYKLKREVASAGRYSFETFEEYVETRWDMEYRRSVQLIDAAAVAENLNNCSRFLPARESHVRPLLKLENEHERAAAWQAVVAKHGSSSAGDCDGASHCVTSGRRRRGASTALARR